jgi:Putative phage abortive infection protein
MSTTSGGVEPKSVNWTPFVILACVVVLLWATSAGVIYMIFGKPIPGPIGDMFGVVNALFSGLAFSGLIFAIFLQREELRLQREELKLQRLETAATREEIKGQKEQAIAQNATLAQQTFDNTFFQLLRLHNDIVSSIDLYNPRNKHDTRGRDCFKVFYERLVQRWNEKRTEDQFSSELDRIQRTYKHFYVGVEAELGHYFRSLYNIVKFVDISSTSDKKIYTNLVRAQLSSYELAMLFYNCLSELGYEKFRPLVQKYSLLKMVPTHELLNSEHHKELYEISAYFSND